MVVLLNGPLGCGKSSLGEALAERIPSCVHLDGDSLLAVNPEPNDPHKLLTSSVRLLASNFLRCGYRNFVINHIWRTPDAIAEMSTGIRSADPNAQIRCFLATLPWETNRERILRRQFARAINELDFELETALAERRCLSKWTNCEVGVPFDVSEPIRDLVDRLLELLRAAPAPTNDPT